MKNRPLFSGCLIVFLLICLGVMTGGAKVVDNFRPSVLEDVVKEETAVRLSGQVYDIDEKDNYQILYLKKSSIIYQNKSFNESKIIIYDEKKLNIEIGNRVEVIGIISFYEEERNPGNFNQKLYYQKKGIHASVWASKISVTDEYVNQLKNMLYDLRVEWKELLVTLLGKEDGTVLAAMLLAAKSGMNEETKELYQANGIGHILAISGLHLSVIGIGLYKSFRRLSGSFLVGGIVGTGFLALYIMMIGISVSVLRALVMFLFRVGADMTGRHYDSPTALVFSALITIIGNPLYLYDGGFWLSYGAIAAIICVCPIFENLPVQGFWASVSINLATLPVLLYYFYEIPLYSMFLNVMVVPLMTVVLTCGMVGSFCCALFVASGPLGVEGSGGILIKICGVVIKVYERMCALFLHFPGARIVAGQPEVWQMGLYYSVLLVGLGGWWYRKKLKQKRSARIFSKAILLIFLLDIVLILCPFTEIMHRLKGNISITLLDVGQGDSIFIRGPKGNTYLIDGGSSDIKSVDQYRIEPFLKSQGVGEIDYVFISHGDGDHINGIREMIERKSVGVAIETIVFPEREVWDDNLKELARLAMGKGIAVVEMKAGQVFTEGEMKICCLAPEDEMKVYHGDSNANSMVLALRYRAFDMLFTGDVEAKGEEKLTMKLEEEYKDTRWDVLKVAHHGSKNSTSEKFLENLLPSYALISAGKENSYGHPHSETIERLTEVGSIILSTQNNGAITIVTQGDKMKIKGYVN